ncbi:MAG: hypothetical protein SGI72_18390 [Planctomycetota bacterium]|mgnify:CR=1 FL=1|nr:hypothetical protein [Planctomycetota bacterium]
MERALFGIVIVSLVAYVLFVGIRAPRTRKLALLALVPAGAAFGAFAWSMLAKQPESSLRIGSGLTAIAGGMAHGVWFSLTALSAKRAWLRLILIPLGMWCGTFASLWFFWHEAGDSMGAPLLISSAATLVSWLALPLLSRDRGFVESGSRRIPSVRFPCPRCGTRVDWGQGIASCTDCGLFLHIYWPADEIQQQAREPQVGVEAKSVRFACPKCRVVSDWPRGDDVCAHCGLKVTLHWNTHATAAPPPKS